MEFGIANDKSLKPFHMKLISSNLCILQSSRNWLAKLTTKPFQKVNKTTVSHVCGRGYDWCPDKDQGQKVIDSKLRCA